MVFFRAPYIFLDKKDMGLYIVQKSGEKWVKNPNGDV
jgi:hypothetical protein